MIKRRELRVDRNKRKSHLVVLLELGDDRADCNGGSPRVRNPTAGCLQTRMRWCRTKSTRLLVGPQHRKEEGEECGRVRAKIKEDESGQGRSLEGVSVNDVSRTITGSNETRDRASHGDAGQPGEGPPRAGNQTTSGGLCLMCKDTACASGLSCEPVPYTRATLME